MALFILRKLVLQIQMRMRSLITGPGKWLSFWRFTSKLSWSWASGARCLSFGWTLFLLPFFMCTNSEGCGETAWMRRQAWSFAGRICDTYHNLMSWLIYLYGEISKIIPELSSVTLFICSTDHYRSVPGAAQFSHWYSQETTDWIYCWH